MALVLLAQPSNDQSRCRDPTGTRFTAVLTASPPAESRFPVPLGGLREARITSEFAVRHSLSKSPTEEGSLKRNGAIKVSVVQFSERFEREAQAIAALNHSTCK